MDRCVRIVTQSIESNSANTYGSFSATVRARAARPSSLLPSSMILECFAPDTEQKCFKVQQASDHSIWRGSEEGERAYAVEFREGVDADVHPLLVDAWGGLRRWHRSVFHRRRCGDSHGADGAAWKQEQRGSSSLGLHRYSSFKRCQHGDLYHVSFHISHIFQSHRQHKHSAWLEKRSVNAFLSQTTCTSKRQEALILSWQCRQANTGTHLQHCSMYCHYIWYTHLLLYQQGQGKYLWIRDKEGQQSLYLNLLNQLDYQCTYLSSKRGWAKWAELKSEISHQQS